MRDRERLVLAGVMMLMALGAPAWAQDCERVGALRDAGKSPAAIAIELGLTTPEVQACLAGVVEETEPDPRRPVPVPFNAPGSTDELRRPPHS
jgi:hypothetical protein